MPAYIIVSLSPKDSELMKAYSSAAAITIKQYQGQFLTKGSISTLHGINQYKAKAIIEFPDLETAEAWYKSPEYQALIPERERAMDSQFSLIAA